MPNPDTYGIYLHIPYCRSKCRYCDFYSAPGTRGVPDEYVTALLRELSKSSRRPDTLYFGGGTPALLRPDQVHRLIKAAAPLPGAEITLEANPDVVTPENLAGFAAAGVTRISFGVQSADDAQLRRLGRTHTAAAAAQAFAWAREAGFREICGDIMLALPYYSIAEFDKTLALLQAGGCTHISAYLLKIEPGTAFGRNPPPGLPDADAAAEFYLYAVQRLAQEGYQVTAIDCTAEMLAEAQANARALAAQITWKLMDAQKLEFADESFDLVLSRNLTWVLEEPETAYAEWYRVLRPKGIMLNFDANWYRYLYDEEMRKGYEAMLF